MKDAFISGYSIDRDCNLYVFSGGTADHTLVNDQAHLNIFSGGSAIDVIENGGYVDVEYGANVTYASHTFSGLVLSNASATVHSGTTANSTTVNFGGELTVFSGGTANSITASNGAYLFIYGGGTAVGIVENGGFVIAQDDEAVTFIPNFIDELLLGNASATIHSGTTANSTTVNSGGELTVFSGGTANSITVNNGACLFVKSGSLTTEVVENGGYVSVEDDAEVTYAPNSFYGLILSNMSATVHSGTTANNTTVNAGGKLTIFSGGMAQEIVENGGYVDVADGANVTFVKNVFSGLVLSQTSATLHSGTEAICTVLNDGRMLILSGGIANNTTVKRGYINVSFGGIANSTTLFSGSLNISNGGLAERTTVVNSIGGISVLSNGGANDTIIIEGNMTVSKGGVANKTIVNSRGSITCVGVANCVTVNSGGYMRIDSGGTATGKMLFESSAKVSFYKGAILNFDLTQVEAGSEALVNDLSIIQGTPVYTLTVDGTQANRVYALADGAADFTGTITVQNTSGDELGILAVGEETVFIGSTGYTLNLTDSRLSVTVDVPDVPAPTNLVGTKDKVSWESDEAGGYVVEYSMDDFTHGIRAAASTNAMDLLDLPAGTYQWRVRSDSNDQWAVGDEIVSDNSPGPAKVMQSNADGNGDVFFAGIVGTWGEAGFFSMAMHVGSINDWNGTNELVFIDGKGRVQDFFFGTSDPNLLCLTDGENGEALFLDDVFTELPKDIEVHQSRIANIREIRAGAGADVIDLTSQRFEYTGGGMTVRGGDGDDTIWANKGDNFLFGDEGNDRIVGASGNDVIVGGIGNDRMHGGGGNDVFTFCYNWGVDNVEQLETGSVTLWFAEGSLDNWNAETLTYTDGENSVKVSGVAVEKVTLKFGDDGSELYATLISSGAFAEFASQKIFEEAKGLLV